MSSILKRILTFQFLIALLSFVLVGVSLFFLFANFIVRYQNREANILEPGIQFTRFQEKLKGVRSVGYLTNKDTSEEHNDGEFLQAQYMLAPTILKLNEPDKSLNILDYESPLYAVFKLKSLNAQTIATSPYGKVLVERMD